VCARSREIRTEMQQQRTCDSTRLDSTRGAQGWAGQVGLT